MPPEAPVNWNSKEYGKYKEGQRTTKVDMGGGGK
jgi:hypothetical protein